MKIALITPTIYASPRDGYAGLEAVSGALAKVLDSQGHEISLFAPLGSFAPTKGGGHLYSAGNPGQVDEVTAWNAYMSNQQARDTLLNADVIHGHTWAYTEYLLRAIKPTARILHTHHGMDPGFRVPPPFKSNLIGISANHTAAMQEKTSLTWRTCYNGVDTTLYPFRSEKGNRFLFVGRMASFKGVLEAIDIANRAKQPMDIIGGSFGDDSNYTQTVKDACAKSVYAKFHGEVDHKKKVALMQQARAVVLPTQKYQGWTEPLGLVGIEAALCGTPTLVTPNGGWVESIQHGYNGFLCNNPEEFLTAMREVDSIKPRLCRDLAIERFSAEVMTKNYLKLYQEVLEGREW